MPTQKRWRCHNCHRQWAFAYHWDGSSCPICHATEIEQMTFQGWFDIDTPGSAIQDAYDAAQLPAPVIQEPPAALLAARADHRAMVDDWDALCRGMWG